MKSFHSVSSAAGSRALLYVFFLEAVWKRASLLSPRGSGECKEPSKDKDSPKIKLHYQLFGAMFTPSSGGSFTKPEPNLVPN